MQKWGSVPLLHRLVNYNQNALNFNLKREKVRIEKKIENFLSRAGGGHPKDRKKKILETWNKSTTNSNGTSAEAAASAASAAAAAAAARGFDFSGYDGNPARHYPYGYPDVNTLVHSWHGHPSLHHQHHQHQMSQHGT